MDKIFYINFYTTAIRAVFGNLDFTHGLQTYWMEDHCTAEISMIKHDIYQGNLQLNVPNSFPPGHVCETNIETWITLDRLMFYFDHIDLPCEHGYLELFDGVSRSGVRIEGLLDKVCGTTVPQGTFAPRSRVLTVRYTTRKQAYRYDVFGIVFTTFRTGDCATYEYECDNGWCILEEVNCNGHNPCGDNSDCHDRMAVAAIVGIVIGAIVGVILLVSAVVFLYCCWRSNKRMPSHQGTTFSQGVVFTNTSGSNVQLPHAGYTPSDNSAPPPTYNVVVGQQPAYPSNLGQQNIQQQHKQQRI